MAPSTNLIEEAISSCPFVALIHKCVPKGRHPLAGKGANPPRLKKTHIHGVIPNTKTNWVAARSTTRNFRVPAILSQVAHGRHTPWGPHYLPLRPSDAQGAYRAVKRRAPRWHAGRHVVAGACRTRTRHFYFASRSFPLGNAKTMNEFVALIGKFVELSIECVEPAMWVMRIMPFVI